MWAYLLEERQWEVTATSTSLKNLLQGVGTPRGEARAQREQDPASTPSTLKHQISYDRNRKGGSLLDSLPL